MLTKFDKALVAVLGVVAQLIAIGAIQGTALHYAQIVIAVATALVVYQTPNKEVE